MIEPVSEVLRQSLEPVLRDMRASGMPEPEVRDGDWLEDSQFSSAWLYSPDGSAVGVRVTWAAAEADRVTEVADQVQEWLVHELIGTSATNWPPCPNHPDNHPLVAAARGRVAVWMCPADSTQFSPVGSLS
jgi:hypothetical protein